VQALPSAAYFLFVEAAVGGIIALFWIHLRDEVPRGFMFFTGVCLLGLAALGVWLRLSFAPLIVAEINPTAAFAFAVERTLSLAFCALLAVHLVGVRVSAWAGLTRLLSPLVPLLGLGWLWSAALVDANAQLVGLGVPLAVLGGGMALGSALVGLSLGHWYLVSPTLSVRPLVGLTFLCLGAVLAQLVPKNTSNSPNSAWSSPGAGPGAVRRVRSVFRGAGRVRFAGAAGGAGHDLAYRAHPVTRLCDWPALYRRGAHPGRRDRRADAAVSGRGGDVVAVDCSCAGTDPLRG
jgi:hypothetical protein